MTAIILVTGGTGRLGRVFVPRLLQAIKRRRPVWSIALPGKAMRDYRAGNHLSPQRAVGRITFNEFVARTA